MSEIDQFKARLLAAGSALPVLFVGSGFSHRYLGSPTWKGILEKFAAETGMPYSFYSASADGEMPETATLIADEFFKIWYSESRFEDSRQDFESKVRSRSDPLKYEISKYLKSLVVKSGDEEDEYKKFAGIQTQAVITTNWDTLIESSLTDCESFIGQSEILFTTLHAVGEVYKIHGCV